MQNLNVLLTSAIKADAAAFSGRQTDLSRAVCGSNQGLRHKITNFRGQALHPDELVALQQVSGSRHTVQEMARLLGGVFVPLPKCGWENDGERSVMTVSLSLAELFQAVLSVQAAGSVSAAERLRLERLAFAVVAALFEWLFGCLGVHHG
ncbi:phage regulatory CII family protein [Conchiformibius kuhniae]|uniref:Phage regulatory CII family protein n=1 Tax=Conchiformibius kuhniae TaxID=211502 RepID=A0A8T9MVX3_9NEIS|nr:phage regulatory CII family protein [Conchiformibius kuhniae]UOP05321.1 hypothetical protein LVJ77_03745 [Conchiformibius kuhniae]